MPDRPTSLPFPDTASLSALRAWYAGVGSREALERYCPQALEGGQSARGVIGRIRRQLASFALSKWFSMLQWRGPLRNQKIKLKQF